MTRWLIWIGLVLAWTLALEFPEPPIIHQEPTPERLTIKFLVAKTIHVGAYAFLTALAALWLPLPARYRWLMMAFLLGHAWLTEWLQQVLYPICFRGGSLGDVGFDLIGVTLGTAITWRRWTTA